MSKPCLTCGEPSPSSYCADHQPHGWQETRRGSARERGYDRAWDKLSARARRLQPFCSDCGTTENLTCDHLPSAWLRKAAGKPLRLRDVDVVCGDCNLARGSSRPGSERAQTQGTEALEPKRDRGAKPQTRMIENGSQPGDVQ